jgi:hypothetical protein
MHQIRFASFIFLVVAQTAAFSCPASTALATDPAPLRENTGFVSLPTEDWPQISGINRVSFSDSRFNQRFVGNGFLLAHGSELYAITAKHVLLLAKTDAMSTVDLSGTGVKWVIHPNQEPAAGVTLGAMRNADSTEKLDPGVIERDWLIFDVERNDSTLVPLKLRRAALAPGAQIYVVGCSYADQSACRQNVLRGTLIEAGAKNLLVDLPGVALETLGGMSGAPVIDGNGDVVGIVSNILPHPTEERDVFAPASLPYLIESLEQLTSSKRTPPSKAEVHSGSRPADLTTRSGPTR